MQRALTRASVSSPLGASRVRSTQQLRYAHKVCHPDDTPGPFYESKRRASTYKTTYWKMVTHTLSHRS